MNKNKSLTTQQIAKLMLNNKYFNCLIISKNNLNYVVSSYKLWFNFNIYSVFKKYSHIYPQFIVKNTTIKRHEKF